MPAAPSAPGANELAGTNWVLASLDGKPPVEGTTATLNFGTDDGAGGTDGCNTFGASYSVDGNTLKFGPVIGTLIACEEPIMAQATAFQKVLAQAQLFAIASDALSLSDGSGKALATFSKLSTNLAGTNWVVTNYNNGKQAVVGVLDGTQITAAFGADGQVTGSAGCNNYFGPFKQDAGKIDIGPLAGTLKLCPEPAGVMDQEMQFLEALQTAATYSFNGDRLDFRTADDALAVALRRAPESTEVVPPGEVTLGGTSWMLATLDGKPPVESTVVTLNFGTDGRASGADGCNNFGAGFKAEGSALTFEMGMSTMMACPEPIMAQATAFQQVLANTKQFAIADDMLTLSDEASKVLATFKAQNTNLAGTNWTVTGYNNGKQAVVSAMEGTTLTLAFGTDGSVTGNAGCNSFMGGYTQKDGTIAIGPLASTRKLCPDPAGVMEQEAQLLKALESAVTYNLDGNTLNLRTADDATAANLSRAP